jgi:hypothetical protein
MIERAGSSIQQMLANGSRLFFAARIQGNIGLPLQSTFAIPVRFAVPNEIENRHGERLFHHDLGIHFAYVAIGVDHLENDLFLTLETALTAINHSQTSG